MKKKTTLKRRVFQDQSFLRSLCKVVSTLGLSCISFFICALKSSKSNIVLAILFILMLCALWLYLYASFLIIMSYKIAKLLFMLFMFDYIILSILNILLEVSKLENFINSKEHILRGSFLATLVLSSSKRERL